MHKERQTIHELKQTAAATAAHAQRKGFQGRWPTTARLRQQPTTAAQARKHEAEQTTTWQAQPTTQQDRRQEIN